MQWYERLKNKILKKFAKKIPLGRNESFYMKGNSFYKYMHINGDLKTQIYLGSSESCYLVAGSVYEFSKQNKWMIKVLSSIDCSMNNSPVPNKYKICYEIITVIDEHEDEQVLILQMFKDSITDAKEVFDFTSTSYNHMTDCDIVTPLACAILKGKKCIINFLIENGASIAKVPISLALDVLQLDKFLHNKDSEYFALLEKFRVFIKQPDLTLEKIHKCYDYVLDYIVRSIFHLKHKKKSHDIVVTLKELFYKFQDLVDPEESSNSELLVKLKGLGFTDEHIKHFCDAGFSYCKVEFLVNKVSHCGALSNKSVTYLDFMYHFTFYSILFKKLRSLGCDNIYGLDNDLENLCDSYFLQFSARNQPVASSLISVEDVVGAFDIIRDIPVVGFYRCSIM